MTHESQYSLPNLKPSRREHGGSLSIGKRRSRRPMDTKKPLHITLRSDFAKGSRSLLRHRPLIDRVIAKAAKRFGIRIYRKAICGSHLHLLVLGTSREGLQNFFRVMSGHIAQEILRQFPISPSARRESAGGASRAVAGAMGVPRDAQGTKGCKKNRRKFWALLLYSRVVTWGREFRTVAKYVEQNVLEALHYIAYKIRLWQRRAKYGGAVLNGS